MNVAPTRIDKKRKQPSATGRGGSAMLQTQRSEMFLGPTPPPEVMERYESLVPGAAAMLFNMAAEEAEHRRKLETQANTANVEAQRKQLNILEYQNRATFRSDLIGQVAGLVVALSCIAGAVYVAMNGHEWVAAGLAAVPTAAVIQAFFVRRQSATHALRPSGQNTR